MRGVRLHDRYVFKAYAAAVVAVLLFFTAIVVVVHLAERSTRLLRNWDELVRSGESPLVLLGIHYATLIPFIWQQVLPGTAALGAALALARLTRHGEIGPLVTAGVGLRRITVPIVVGAGVLSLALLGLEESLIPALSRAHLRTGRMLVKTQPDRIDKLPHFDDASGARLSAAAWKPLSQEIEGALLTMREPDGRLVELRWYPELAWDEPTGTWRAPRGGTRFPLEDEGAPRRAPIAADEPVPLQADLRLLETSLLKDQVMGLSREETASLLEAHPDNPRLQRLHHEQLTRPLSVIVMVLLTLPLALRIGRKRAIPGVAAALGSATLYYAVSFLVGSLTSSGLVNAVVVTWTPTVLFGALGLALWMGMDRAG